nr:YhdP family protein [Cupriavidus gilardii]
MGASSTASATGAPPTQPAPLSFDHGAGSGATDAAHGRATTPAGGRGPGVRARMAALGPGAGHGMRRALRHPCWRRLARWLLMLAAAGAVLVVVMVLLVRFVLWPQAATARGWLEERGSALLSAHVTIEALTTGWQGWHPSFHASGVRVVDRQQRLLLAADTVDGTLSWRSLTHLQPRFARFDAAHADVLVHRDARGAISVAGMPVAADSTGNDDHRFFDWLLAQGHVDIRDGKVRWLDEQRGLPLLEVGDIQLSSSLSGARHTVRLEARSESLSPQPLVLTGSFRHTYLHQTGDWRNWRGQASWNISRLHLPALQRYTALVEQVTAGTLSTDGTVEFANGHIQRSQVRLRALDLNVRLQGAAEPLRLTSAQALLLHRFDDGDDQLTVDTLLWEPAGAQAQAAAGAWREGMRKVVVRWARHDDNTLRRFALKAPTLDLDAVRALATALPVDGDIVRELRVLQPSGRLDNLDLRWSHDAASLLQRQRRETRYHVQGTLRDVAVRERPAEPAVTADGHARIGVPGFSGLSGSFSFDQRGGNARFTGSNATLVFPGLFDDPRLAFDELAGQFSWRRIDGKLAVDTDGVRFANADAVGTVRGSWRQGGDGHAGIADLRGELTRAQVQRVPRYLPLEIPQTTRRYLTGALAAGEAQDVQFRVNGDLAHFPFQGDNARHGDFRVEVPLKDAAYRVDPHPVPAGNGTAARHDWPLFTGIEGDLLFERAAMSLTVRRATVQGIAGVTLRDVNGRVDRLDHHGRLTLDGAASGPVQSFLRYIAASPVREWTGQFTDDSRASGNGELRLKLDMPLADAHGAKVDGRFRLANNDIVLMPGMPVLGGASGTIAFSERGFQLDGVRARWLGGDARASGGTQPDGTIRVNASGTASARGLADALAGTGAAALGGRLSGATGWQATLGVRERQPVLSFSTELNGLGIDLPAPFAKPAAQATPVRLELRPVANRPDHQDLELQYGAIASARYLIRRDPAGAQIVHGGIGVGTGAPTPASGITAALALERLDVDAWRSALATPSPAGAAVRGATPAGSAAPPPVALLPERITTRTRTLRAFGRELEDVTLEATRSGTAARPTWHARIESQQIAGQLAWRPDDSHAAGAVTMRLSRLTIPDSDDASQMVDALASRIDELPSIDLTADAFHLRGHDFGRLSIKAHSEVADGEPVWTLQSLTLEQPGATFTGSGSWRVPRRMRADADAQRRTMLAFSVDIRNAGSVLDRLGMSHTLRDGKGKLEGRVRWIGSPLAIDYPSLGGRVSLQLENGQILRVEPGAAKLLGVLSLQSVMRLATLDFRGIAGQGLVFDDISATGTIENGVATTDDFRLKSPAVNATMKGSADIPRETQDLHVALVPRINATSASVAAAFVNPALGIGTLAAQLLFADEFSKAFTQHYRVTGSWADPQIAKVGDNGQDRVQVPDQRQPEQSLP